VLCIGPVASLGGEGPFAVTANGLDLVIVKTERGLRAYQGRCPHQGALLGEGEMDGDALVCRNHRWRFDATTGMRRGGPECLVSCPVETRGAELWVDTTPLKPAEVTRQTARRQLEDLPGPKGLPLVGNVFQMDLKAFHIAQERWAAEYGPMYVYRLGPNTLLGLSDARLNESCFAHAPKPIVERRTSSRCFAKWVWTGSSPPKAPLGDHSVGSRWKRCRIGICAASILRFR